MSRLLAFLKDETGSSAVEDTLLLASVVAYVIAGNSLLGEMSNKTYETVNRSLVRAEALKELGK